MMHQNPTLVAALAALEKEAQTNATAAHFWKYVEPQKHCAWTILRALLIADAHQDYNSGEYCDTWPALCAVVMATLIDGVLPLPKRMVQ